MDWVTFGWGWLAGVGTVVLAVAALVIASGGLSQGASYGRGEDW
jgi:hypothetical protein